MLSSLTLPAFAAPAADLVTSMPGFNFTGLGFQVYSGYLTVPGPFDLTSYDSLEIHYQFHTSQSKPSTDPVVTWHQGGPGGSSIEVGLYTEMGYFQISDQGETTNPYAWNNVANMLYLESPAGSGQSSGFSACIKGGRDVGCSWDDVSQAEAYAHTLAAFKKAFPEFASNDVYLTGESYFGQYGPNIANYILTHAPFNTSLGLKGIAAGNACWGGSATRVQCNGPNSEQNDVDMYYGKGLVSKKLYTEVYATCDFPSISRACDRLLDKVSSEVGPHNVYNIYDNCPRTAEAVAQSGKPMRALLKEAREAMSTNSGSKMLSTPTGGYDWECGGPYVAGDYLTKKTVEAALHLKQPGRSRFNYHSSGPASITLWPFLAKSIRVLIYNGDADACVPYKGNEEWITGLEKDGTLSEVEAWRPWYTGNKDRAPSGYATKYSVSGSANELNFVTIRLAGHMVPTFQPAASLAMFERFLGGQPY
jgi:hypothetical protein